VPSSKFIQSIVDRNIRDVVARNVLAVRQSRGLTLNGLSEMSGIGKGALSGIESQSGNPSIETVWQLAKALDVPFGQLVENDGAERSVVDPGVIATLIDSQTSPQTIETFLFEIAPNTIRKAEAHMTGVKEHVVVLRGHFIVGSEEAPMYLQSGQTHSFAADANHIYRTLDQPVTAIVTVVYPNSIKISSATVFDQNRAWPWTDDEWMGLNLQVSRLKLEVSQGIDSCRLNFDICDLSKSEVRAELNTLVRDDSEFRHTVQTFATLDHPLSLIMLSRPHAYAMMKPASNASEVLIEATRLANRASSLWRALTNEEIATLREDLQSKACVTAALAAEVLTRHGHPSVPARIKPKQLVEKNKRYEMDAGVSFEDRIDVDSYAAYELVHPAYAKQAVAIANQISACCGPGENRLLDVGTGPGLPLKMLLELIPHLEATAVDPSEVAFQHLCYLFKNEARVTPVLASITDFAVEPEQLFDIAISVGASHHLNTSHFLQATYRNLKPGGLFLVSDEMVAPFLNVSQRNGNLIAHHLQYVLDTMVELPPALLSEAELVLMEVVKQQAPVAVYEARSGDVTGAANRCRLFLKTLRKLKLPEPVSHELLAYYRFHFLELEALVAGLDYEVEQKTYARKFVDLAQHAGFELCEHSRLYATHGTDEWDAGTHLFVLRALR
jgi:transcriptional regulator with XRE-family HTH domain/SAM-dependent methyltransferase